MDGDRVDMKVVAVLPPRLDREVVLLTFQVGSGELFRLSLSRDIAMHLGTCLLLEAGQAAHCRPPELAAYRPDAVTPILTGSLDNGEAKSVGSF